MLNNPENKAYTLILLGIVYLLYLVTSCSSDNTKKIDDEILITKISYDSLIVHKSKKLPIDNYNIIVLNNLKDECLFSQNSKTIIKDSIIYILDRGRNKKLVKYDLKGNALSKIGELGQGPKEYMNITDFDVAENGDIYILDAMQNIVLTFNNRGEFVDRHLVPHDIFAIRRLNDGGFLLGVYPWDRHGSKYNVIKVNPNFEEIGGILPMNTKYDSNYLFRFPEIGKSDSGYSFNYEIDNNITILNSEGDICAIYSLDFGKFNVLDNDKDNVEDNANINNSRFIVGATYYDNNNLWLNIHNRQDFCWIKIDLIKNEALYVPVESSQQFVGFHNGYPIITSNDIDNCPIEISDSIKNLVETQEHHFIAIHE